MTALAAAPTTFDTVAELLDQLGGIPPERVLLHPQPGHATEQDVIRLLDGDDKRLCELVDGVLVEKGMDSTNRASPWYSAISWRRFSTLTTSASSMAPTARSASCPAWSASPTLPSSPGSASRP